MNDERAAAAGPPWTMTTIGALPCEGAGGESSQPCTSSLSLFQVRLRAPPAGLFTAALRWVMGFQAPMGPATTSGGLVKLSRTAAEVLPSAASARLMECPA